MEAERTATNLCKKVKISAAFEFFFVSATTIPTSSKLTISSVSRVT